MPAIRKRLTDELIADLPVRKKRHLVWDVEVPSLAVRVGKARKTFVLVTRFGKSTTRKSVGLVSRITVKQARERARRLLTALEGEHDSTVTVAEVLDKLVDSLSGRRYGDELDRTIRRDAAHLLSRPIASVTRRDIVAALDARKAKRSNRPGKSRTESAAHHLAAYLKRLFNYAVDRDIIPNAPTDRLNTSRIIGAKVARSRVLTDDELKRVWNAAARMSDDYRDTVQLLILTGLRRSELTHARCKEIDLEARTFTISAERMKMATAHCVYLAPLAYSILQRRMSVTEASQEFLFGRPLNGFSKAKRKLDELSGITEHWTLHDLRRTFRSRLAALGVGDTVAELSIAHSMRGIAATYNRHRYQDELRDAFERYDALVQAIVSSKNQASELVP